jgi:hypothetical protein
MILQTFKLSALDETILEADKKFVWRTSASISEKHLMIARTESFFSKFRISNKPKYFLYKKKG